MRQLLLHHRLVAFPEQAALGLVQVVWAAVATVGHPDQRLLRLTIVPFVVLVAIGLRRLARDLGATSWWADAAALCFVTSPIFLGVSTAFMTDVPYVALLIYATIVMIRWVRDGTGLRFVIVLTVLAGLQRQHGGLIAATLVVGLISARRWRQVRAREWVAAAALVVAMGGIAVIPFTIGFVQTVAPARWPTVFAAINPLIFSPLVLAFIALPLGGACWRLHGGDRQSAVAIAVAAVAAMSLAVALFLMAHSWRIFPGYHWANIGLNPANVWDGRNKNPVYSTPLFLAIEVLTMSMVALLMIIRAGTWTPSALGVERAMVGGLGLSHVAVMLNTGWFDRYDLPIAAMLLPLLASMIPQQKPSRPALWCAVGGIALNFGLYVVGEQDYIAWQVARDDATRLAITMAAPEDVDSGYEAYGVYVELPTYERTGRETRPSKAGYLPSQLGPVHPRLQLRFASADDSRPGSVYRSVASGKIIIIRVHEAN
ncbi:MAG: hypothetical protein ACYDGR_10400 [Candidatus Dormibacteria bacterium]